MATGGSDSEFSSISLLSDQDEAQSAGLTVDTSFITAPNIAIVLLDFKSSPVYRLEFTYNQKGQTSPVVSVDNEIVVRLESDEKKTAFNELVKRFNVTDGEIDVQNRVIKLKYTKTAREIADTWKKSVCDDFRKGRVSLLTWALVDLGERAADVKPQIEERFAAKGLICELSDDKQKLLLLSSNPSDTPLKEAENFARNANPIAALNSEFYTSNGIHVLVYKSDITEVPADCVVSAVDENLSFGGGVSAAIALVAGKEMLDECARRKLKVTEVFVSKGGKRWKNVIHACGPRWSGPEKQIECGNLLTATVLNCLKEAHRLKLKTIALPSVSSGTFQVPETNSAKSYLDAIVKFDLEFGKKTTLKHIIFMDCVEGKVTELRGQMLASSSMQSCDVLRVVLVGKTGVGKSHTGNSLSGPIKGTFRVARSLRPVTHNSQLQTIIRRDCRLEVVDTPGLFDKAKDQARGELITREILKSVVLSLPGPHVFLMVFRGDERFNEAEVNVCKKIKDLFREQLVRYLIVVFTHIRDQADLQDLLKEVDQEVTDLLIECENRVVGIDNGGSGVQQQVDELVDMALKLRATNSTLGQPFYTDDMVNRCLQLLQSEDFANSSLEAIKLEIQKTDERITEKLSRDSLLKNAAQKSWFTCNIL